jgi:hypothetical protein
VGTTSSFGAGGRDVYLVRTDGTGQELWQRTFGTPGDEDGRDVRALANGDLVILGYYALDDDPDEVHVVRTDADGATLWSTAVDGGGAELPTRIIPTADQGFVVVGDSYTPSTTQGWLAKLDAGGDLVWQRTVGGTTPNHQLLDIAETADGGFIACGVALGPSPGLGDYYAAKLDSTGHEQWSRTYGLAKWDAATSLAVLSDGGYVFGGEQIDPAGSPWVGLAWLVRTDADGNVLWTHRYGLPDADQGISDLAVTRNGDIVMVDVGAVAPPANGFDVFLARASSDGTELFSRRLGLAGISPSSFSVQETVTGGLVVAATQSNDAALIKTDANGTLPPPAP